MNTPILDKINREQERKDAPVFKIGDTVRVHVRIKEAEDKERVQVYTGIVIARDGRGSTETFTVRRISYGEGVERVFPVHSPSVAKVEVERPGKTRRAKLYYLRGRTGKKAKVRTRDTSGSNAAEAAPVTEAAAAK